MTFNLRFENEIDGKNSWEFRKGAVAEIIRRYSPSIIGTQEGRPSQLYFLALRLPDYSPNMPPSRRQDDPTCQYPTLFFKKELFNLKESGEFWLSKTPDVHRSKDWDSAFPRMINFAKLTYKGTDYSLWVAVTHLDNKGQYAREMQAEIITEWIKEKRHRIILIGDFNDEPGSKVHEKLKSFLIDTWEKAGRGEGESGFTYHGFTGVPKISRMDWILVSNDFEVKRVMVIRDKIGGGYPSDHFPYLADLIITEDIHLGEP